MTDGSTPGLPQRAGDEPPPQESRATQEASGPNLRPRFGYGGMDRSMAAAVGQQQGAAAHAAPRAVSPSTQMAQAQEAQTARTTWGVQRPRTAAQMQAASQQQASLQAEMWQTPQGAGLQAQTSEDGVATERSQLAAEGTRPSQGRPSGGDPFGGSGASPPLWGQQALQVGGAAPPHALGEEIVLHQRNQELQEQILQLRRELLESQRREHTAIARLSIVPTEDSVPEEGARERVGRTSSEYFKPLTTTEAQGCKITMTQPLARTQLASALETIRAKMPKNRYLGGLTSTDLSRERLVSYDVTGARVVTKSEMRREYDGCATRSGGRTETSTG